MIIFGVKDVEKQVNKGTFFCPTCRNSHVYQHVEISPHITIYFYPIFQLRRGAEYIECYHCKNTFLPNLLEKQRNGIDEEVEAEFKKSLKRILIMAMSADSIIKPIEIQEASKIYEEITGEEFSKSDIIYEKSLADNENLTLDAYLRRARFLLNDSGKEAIIIAALGIISCDNELHPDEMSFVQSCSEALTLSQHHLESILVNCGMTSSVKSSKNH